MKNNLLKKLVVISLFLAGMIAIHAQSLQIKYNTSPVSGYKCMNIDDLGTTFYVDRSDLESPDTNVSITSVTYSWNAAGGIEIGSGAGTNSVSVSPLTGTTYASGYSKYAKGELTLNCHVVYSYEITPTPCPGDTARTYTYSYGVDYSDAVEIRKEFSSLAGNAIVGPVCVSPGDSITYSVAPWVSLYQMNQVGFDSYYWNIPTGVNAGNLYYSADSSSVTFTAGNDIAGKTISVTMGRCNTSQNPLTFTLGQEPADPIFEGKDLNTYCLPFGVTRDTIIITNPQPDVNYTWDLRSWTANYTSEKGDTIVYTPLNNAQTVTLKMNGGCADKTFIYDINRSITLTDSINTDYGYCLPGNSDLTFYLKNVPDGTEMEWTVLSGTGWSIADNQKNKAKPTIHVGTGTGVVSAKTSKCTNNAVTFTFNVKPAIPGTITGTTCLDIDSIAAETYSVTPVLNATAGYQWSYPKGWQVNGLDSVNSTISLIPSGQNGGEIKVRAIGCDTSNWSSPLKINMTPNRPDAVLVNSCVDAGLPGTITVKVNNPIINTDVTYNWTILDSNLGSITTYRNPLDPSERRIATTGNTGSFLVTVSALSTSCGAGILDTITVNVNKDDLPYAFLEIQGGSIFAPTYRYQLNLGMGDLNWYNNHTFVWDLQNSGVVTDPAVPYQTVDTLQSGLLTQTARAFSLTVYNKTTGCKTRKTATGTGMRSAKATNSTPSSDIAVSPNPASNNLKVTSLDVSPLDISIYDLNGKFMKQITNETSPVNIDVSNFQSGVYILYAEQSGVLFNKKFIKK